ncbi:MAG: hypothetical protein EPN45_01285 [Rhizobiaceae bacterium]|nr:MAG: hypothetical protein EPN45_01285 [Rhizobiaceae bacterium]
MTPERFSELAEIYGAELRRWPEDRREAAAAYSEAYPEEAERTLAAARRLDEALDGYAVTGPGAKLTMAIVEATPSFRTAARRMQLWWQGAGFAALGLAGALAGALAIALLMPMTVPPDEGGAYAMTAFSDMAQIVDE